MGQSPFAKPTAADFVPPIEKYVSSTGRGDFAKPHDSSNLLRKNGKDR
jgi:hypothetical protein